VALLPESPLSAVVTVLEEPTGVETRRINDILAAVGYVLLPRVAGLLRDFILEPARISPGAQAT
jgi:hypothetical protein